MTNSCKNCGQPIEFRPHPLNAGKLAPFNRDGEIHFATCQGKSRAKREYFSRNEILCKICEELPLFVYGAADQVEIIKAIRSARCLLPWQPETARGRIERLVREYRARFPVAPDVEPHLG